MTRAKITTPQKVTIKTSEVGQRFGCCGKVVAGNGRVIHETRVFPYGFHALAFLAAQHWAENHGHIVRNPA